MHHIFQSKYAGSLQSLPSPTRDLFETWVACSQTLSLSLSQIQWQLLKLLSVISRNLAGISFLWMSSFLVQLLQKRVILLEMVRSVGRFPAVKSGDLRLRLANSDAGPRNLNQYLSAVERDESGMMGSKKQKIVRGASFGSSCTETTNIWVIRSKHNPATCDCKFDLSSDDSNHEFAC